MSALTASASFLGMILGPIAAAADAKLCGSRVVATDTSMPLRANALARAWPILPKPIIECLIVLSNLVLMPGSDLRHASIDGEIYAGDERTFLGGEERDGSRDFLRLASATHWDLRGELCDRLLDLFSGEACRRRQGRGIDGSGAHTIHTDFAVFQLQSPSAREVAHRRLARGVGAKPWQPQHV